MRPLQVRVAFLIQEDVHDTLGPSSCPVLRKFQFPLNVVRNSQCPINFDFVVFVHQGLGE